MVVKVTGQHPKSLVRSLRRDDPSAQRRARYRDISGIIKEEGGFDDGE